MRLRTPALLAAIATSAVAAALPAAASASGSGIGIGPDAELRYGAVDFQWHNSNETETTGKLKVTAHGKVLGSGKVTVNDSEDSWSGIYASKFAKKREHTGPIRGKVTGTIGGHRVNQPITVQTGSTKWDGTYKASNGLLFKVKDGFGYDLTYGTLAYCARSGTNTNAFYALPFDQLPAIVKPNGRFATKGHIDTGMIQKINGRITKSHELKGYASWTWINIFAGPDPGDYDYCATGGKFHGKRISKKVG